MTEEKIHKVCYTMTRLGEEQAYLGELEKLLSEGMLSMDHMLIAIPQIKEEFRMTLPYYFKGVMEQAIQNSKNKIKEIERTLEEL